MLAVKKTKRLFTCSDKECDFHINEGEEKWLPRYTDSQGGLWCPCCHSKLRKEEEK